MMDSAADDLMTASIGRSPRNDTSGGSDPPGSRSGAQADFHGLPLDNATNPASTEARLRQFCVMCAPPMESDRDSCICTCAQHPGRSVVCRVLCGGAVSVTRVRDVTSVQSDPVACSERITIVARAELGSILDSGYDLRCYEHVVAVFFRLV